jgi:hypothetical protein
MVSVNFILFDGEAIRLVSEAGQKPRSLLGRLCQFPRRIDADDLYPAGLGKAVKKDEQEFHARGPYSHFGETVDLEACTKGPATHPFYRARL